MQGACSRDSRALKRVTGRYYTDVQKRPEFSGGSSNPMSPMPGLTYRHRAFGHRPAVSGVVMKTAWCALVLVVCVSAQAEVSHLNRIDDHVYRGRQPKQG